MWHIVKFFVHPLPFVMIRQLCIYKGTMFLPPLGHPAIPNSEEPSCEWSSLNAIWVLCYFAEWLVSMSVRVLRKNRTATRNMLFKGIYQTDVDNKVLLVNSGCLHTRDWKLSSCSDQKPDAPASTIIWPWNLEGSWRAIGLPCMLNGQETEF